MKKRMTLLVILGFLISTMSVALAYQVQVEPNNEASNTEPTSTQGVGWGLAGGEILFALNQSYYDDAGGQANYGQIGYIWNFTATGPVSFLILNSTYLERFYDGSIYEVRNVTSDYGHSKVPESPRERYQSPTGQFYFYLIFWNEGETPIDIYYEVQRYRETPTISCSLEDSNPDWFFTTEEAADYLGAIITGDKAHPINPPPAANRTYLSEDFNLTVTVSSDFVDWSPSQYWYIMNNYTIHGVAGSAVSNIPDGEFYDGPFNITMDISLLSKGWIRVSVKCNLVGLVDNRAEWTRWIYLQP